MGAAASVAKSENALRIGIIGASRVAEYALINAAKHNSNVSVVAVASRSLEKANEYARKHHILSAYGSYEELLQDRNVDAVYVSLPNSHHAQWSEKALISGKHVLCEKPLTSNFREAEHLQQVAAENDRILYEAVHSLHHPALSRFKTAIGEIGGLTELRVELGVFWMAKYFASEMKMDDIRMQFELSGGAFMDMGTYAVHFVRFLTGEEPQVVSAQAELANAQVDRTMRVELTIGTARCHIIVDFNSKKLLGMKIDATGEKGK